MTATGHDGLSVSISQLKQFLRCPRQYELQRVLGVEPAFVPFPLAFGSAIHRGLAAHYQGIRDDGEAPSLEAVLAAFSDEWSRALASPVPLDRGDGEDAVNLGTRMLEAFRAHAVVDDAVEVEAVEMPFSGVSLHDPDTGELLEERLTGVVDLVVREGEARVVVEHKTAARRWTADQLEYDFQATAYQLAAREIGLGDVRLRYQIVTKTKVAAVQVEDVARGVHAENDFLRVAAGVTRAIGAGAFWPNRIGWQCRTCPYAHACL